MKRVFKRPDAFSGADAGMAGYIGNRYFFLIMLMNKA